MRASTSANTRRAYTQHWRQFTEYCARRRRAALPADARTVCAYLAVAADAGRRPSTIGQAVAAITFVHRLAKHTLPSAYPEVRTLLQGIRRTVGTEQRQMRPLLLDDMHQMMATLEGCGLRDVRDRAVILLSWSLMLRRSELCALDVRDVELRRGCVVVTIRRSKTDQAGQGISKSVARLPVDHASRLPGPGSASLAGSHAIEIGTIVSAIGRRGAPIGADERPGGVSAGQTIGG